MDNNHSRPRQPSVFPIRFCLGKDERSLASTLVSALPITHLILILPGVLHYDWMVKVRLEEISHNCFEKNFTCILQTEPLRRREYGRAVASRSSPRPCWRWCRGAPATRLGGPGRSRPLHAKFSGQRYLNLFNPRHQMYLLILSMINIF